MSTISIYFYCHKCFPIFLLLLLSGALPKKYGTILTCDLLAVIHIYLIPFCRPLLNFVSFLNSFLLQVVPWPNVLALKLAPAIPNPNVICPSVPPTHHQLKRIMCPPNNALNPMVSSPMANSVINTTLVCKYQ